MNSLRAVLKASEANALQPQLKTVPLSEFAKAILDSVEAEEDVDSRGVTEVIDNGEFFDQTAFYTKLTNRGPLSQVPSAKFKRAMRELVESGWLEQPETQGKSRLYRYIPRK